jgi:hypothetical protein
MVYQHGLTYLPHQQ